MADPTEQPTPVQRAGMRNAIVQAAASSPAYLAFTNGLILLYLSAQGVSSERIVLYLAVPLIASGLGMLPAAYFADRIGRRRVGIVGICMELAGFSLITASASMPPHLIEAVTAAGIALHSAGGALYVACWFALLSPIVPEGMRGRFFGKLRYIWQVFCIFFTAACALNLSAESPLYVFQIVNAIITALLLVRIWFYIRIPDLETSRPAQGFFGSMSLIVREPGFMSFCAYVFLLMLFTTACPTLFGLIEKRVLGWGDSKILWMGNLYMVGAVVGFVFGGRMVDRWTTKPVFMLCHFGYGVLMLLFLARSVAPEFIVWVVGTIHLLFGVVWAASSIAISTEMLALVPADSKALSTSFCMTLHRGGGALSGAVTAAALKLGMLNESWQFMGQTLTRYDTILVAFGVMVILLVVTLGLVPSVLRKAEWVSRATT